MKKRLLIILGLIGLLLFLFVLRLRVHAQNPAVGNINVVGGGGINADNPPASPTTMDDEFNGSAISGLWDTSQIGTGTATASNGWLKLSAPNTAGSDTADMILQTLPAAPWTFVAKCSFYPLTSANSWYTTLVLRESSTSKIISWGGSQGSTPLVSGPKLRTVRWTNSTTASAEQLVYFQNPATVPIANAWWLQVSKAGTTLNWSISFNGVNFTQVDTSSQTAFFTTAPDQIGLMASCTSSGGGSCSTSTLSCDYFRRTQ